MEKNPIYFYKKECFLDDILVDTNLFLSPHEIIARAALTSFFPALSATTETSSFGLRSIWPSGWPPGGSQVFHFPH